MAPVNGQVGIEKETLELAPLGLGERPLFIAGPCSAESEEQVFETAAQIVKETGVRIFRAGVWKPRTRPNAFEGRGEAAFTWLKMAKKEYGLKLAVEVANAQHVKLALQNDIDILWIGARSTASPFTIQEIADVLHNADIPVLVKNPINPDLGLWIGALERLNQAGVKRLAAVHRGFSTFAKMQYRNEPMWRIPIELKRLFPSLPIFVDPSHIAGKRALVSEVCQKAMDIDMDGIMVETHFRPETALSDAAQQITPLELSQIMSELKVRKKNLENPEFEIELEKMRRSIDDLDSAVLASLSERMKIVAEIAELKIRFGVTALQLGRLDQLMKDRLRKASSLSLDSKLTKEIFESIHSASVRRQTLMMREAGKNN